MSTYDEADDEKMEGFHFDDEEGEDELSDEDEIDPQKDTFFTEAYDDETEQNAK